MAQPPGGRTLAPSASMHHLPGRPWCLPAPGSRQGSVHGLHQGATVQGSSCGPPAHSGTMERHVWVSRGEKMGGIGTGAGEATPEGRVEGKRGCGYSLGGLGSPRPYVRDQLQVCMGGGTAGPGGLRYKRWSHGLAFLGAKAPPAERYLLWPGCGAALHGQKGGMVATPPKCVCVQFGFQGTRCKGT